MEKTYFLTALLSISSMLFVPANAESSSSSRVETELRSESISRIFNTPDNRPPDSHHHFCDDSEFEKPVPLFVSFSKPNESSKTIAVLKYSPGEPELNPRASFRDEIFSYGAIPELKNISKTDANQLWGTPGEINASNEVSYPLDYSVYSIKTKRIETKTGYLDLIFNNDRIQKYRVRCDISNTGWILVHKGGEWANPTLLLLGCLSAALFVRLRY